MSTSPNKAEIPDSNTADEHFKDEEMICQNSHDYDLTFETPLGWKKHPVVIILDGGWNSLWAI